MDGETFRSYNDKTNIYSVICDIIHNIIDYNYFVNIYIYIHINICRYNRVISCIYIYIYISPCVHPPRKFANMINTISLLSFHQ